MKKNNSILFSEFHKPVMVREVISLLEPSREYSVIKGKAPIFIDCTVGGGGHAQVILENLSCGIVVGLDCDSDAISYTKNRLQKYSNFHLFHTNYINIDKVIQEFPDNYLQGVLFDLGVSYHQITTPSRGFSYSSEGPLDMRFDGSLPSRVAKDLLKQNSLKELIKIFSCFGEERYAKRIATHIHAKRNDIKNTFELANAIREVTQEKNQNKTLARIFQSLRIVVNNELHNIKIGLDKAVKLLTTGARIVVIAYHSLEDRIVKLLFRDYAKLQTLKILTKKPLRSQLAEINTNASARSARLRAAEKI